MQDTMKTNLSMPHGYHPLHRIGKTLGGLALLLTLGLASCQQEPRQAFDQPAADRLDAASREFLKTLKSSTNGWILELYPHRRLKYGGYLVALKFGDKNMASVASESPVPGEPTNAWVRGGYHVKNDKGITLSFDTYTLPLHFFSDPDKSEGDGTGYGFQGDYEFTLMRSTSPDTLLVRGRKTGNVMRLIRARQDAKETLDAAIALKAKTPTAHSLYTQHCYGLSGKIGGKEVIVYPSEGGYNSFTIEEPATGKREDFPYAYTTTGIHFRSPFAGVSDLLWDETEQCYRTAAGDKLTPRQDPDYQGFAEYLGKYDMKCVNWPSPREVTFAQHARNVYSITGIAPRLVVLASYDPANKRFEIQTQRVTKDINPVRLIVWDADAARISWGEGLGMYSKLDPSYTAGKKYVLVSNGRWGYDANSLYLYVINVGAYKGFGGDFAFQKPTFTKK